MLKTIYFWKEKLFKSHFPILDTNK